nr:transposase, MuDR [Tanacetum cinerariifolium]
MWIMISVFPAVFCLKINHGGAYTPPTKIRYKGGKVNWVDTIDFDVFSVVKVNTVMKKLGYEKPSFDDYYKEPKTDLDNGLKKLSSDQDVLQMLKYVKKYKVIDLYVDHSITKEALNVDESLLVNELDNDLFIGNEMLWDNDELDYGFGSQNASDRDDGSNSDDGSNRDDGSASDDDSDSDFLVDPNNMIDDVEVDMAEFRSNIDANVEWVGSKAILTMEEKEFEVEKVNLDELDSGSYSEYEGERKKALKMYHKMNKANAFNAESSGRAHYNVLLNNMCEVLNRQLVDGRDKPIKTCLEFIREYLMKRIVNVQKATKKRKKSDAELAEGMVRGNKLSRAAATQTRQSSQAPPATQASQTSHTTPFHPSQLHALPTKMTKASAARRTST